jgi:hypothetical protein
MNFNSPMDGRAHRKFWVLDDDEMPVEAEGYDCPPNDDIWWFPSLGFSTGGVYPTREAAFATARKRLLRLRDSVNARLAKLDEAAP